MPTSNSTGLSTDDQVCVSTGLEIKTVVHTGHDTAGA